MRSTCRWANRARPSRRTTTRPGPSSPAWPAWSATRSMRAARAPIPPAIPWRTRAAWTWARANRSSWGRTTSTPSNWWATSRARTCISTAWRWTACRGASYSKAPRAARTALSRRPRRSSTPAFRRRPCRTNCAARPRSPCWTCARPAAMRAAICCMPRLRRCGAWSCWPTAWCRAVAPASCWWTTTRRWPTRPRPSWRAWDGPISPCSRAAPMAGSAKAANCSPAPTCPARPSAK